MTAMIFGRTALTLSAARRGVEPKSIEFATADRLIFRLGRDRPNVKFTIAARMRKTSPAKNVKKSAAPRQKRRRAIRTELYKIFAAFICELSRTNGHRALRQ
jgi:hypothetical protein